jgi:hypothetical protein
MPVKKSEEITTVTMVEVFMDALPVGCSVYFYYQKNKSGNWVQAYTADGQQAFTATNGKKATFRVGEEMDIYERRIVMVPNGNITPNIFRVRSYFE